MARLSAIAFWIFLVAYVAAIAIYLIGFFNLFGQEQDPIAAVFMILLGLPWNRFVQNLPESYWPIAVAAAPLINLLILLVLKRRLA